MACYTILYYFIIIVIIQQSVNVELMETTVNMTADIART